jgi:tellurite resistance protein
MGVILASYFDKAKASGGIAAQVKLAMLTKMARAAALQAHDSAENIKIFDEAIKQIYLKAQ